MIVEELYSKRTVYKMEKPLVTIMISCYNHEQFVEDCLKSIYAQTYSNIELLIIDDASVDKSFEIIKLWEYKLKDKFVNVFIEKNNVNKGLTRNLNKLIKMSRGYYIKEIASDDMLMPNAIEDFVIYAEKSDADIIYSNAYIINELTHYDNLYSANLSVYYNNKFIPKNGMYLTKKLCAGNFICAPAVLIPRSTFEKYGLYDDRFSFEDWEYWLRVSVDGKIEYMNSVTVYYRITDCSFSHFKSNIIGFNRQKNFYNEKKKIIEKYKKYCGNEEIASFYNRELSEAISIYNYELVKFIVQEMKDNNFKVTIKIKIEIILAKLYLYPIVKKLKNEGLKKFCKQLFNITWR